MNYRSIYLLSVILLLIGCATDPAAEQNRATKQMQYKMQVYGPACEALGLKKDTDAWRDCIQREYEQSIMRQQNQWGYPYYPYGPYRSPYFGSPYYYYR